MGKNMAVIENGTVTAVNWYADREQPSAALAETEGRAVSEGDTYADGSFFHEDTKILNDLEQAEAALDDALSALNAIYGGETGE